MKYAPILCVVLLAGCSEGWTINSAQRAVTTGAEVVQALDESVAPILREEVRAADIAEPTRAGFLARLEPWRPVWMGLMVARSAFFLAQRTLDAWRAGSGPAGFIAAGACILAGLTAILDAPIMREHTVLIPAELRTWIATFSSLATGTCDQRMLDLDLGAQ